MSSSTFNSRAVLKAYGLAAVVVIAVHAVFLYSDSVWRELYRLSDPVRDDALRYEARLRLASAETTDAPVILMGSSQAREDFDVEYLNNRFGHRHRFINLGVSGQGNPIEMYMMTPRIIETKPSVVVYMPFVGSLYYPYFYATFGFYFDPNIVPIMSELYGWGEVVDHSGLIARGYLGRWSILYRYRGTLRYLVDDAIVRWLTDAPPKSAETYAYHRRKSDGHFQQLIEQHEDRPRFHDHIYRPFAQEAFRMLARSLGEHGIALVVVDGPTHADIRHVYDPKLDTAYEQFWQSAAAEHGFTYLPGSELPRFDDVDFNDFTHLNARGRARFTAFIADYLERNAERLGIAGR